MADQDTGTEVINGGDGTGATPAAATPQPTPDSGKPAGTPTPDNNDGDQVTLSKKDYAALIGQRDRANNQGAQTDEAFQQLQYDFYKKQAVDQTASTYPDVPRSILESAESPEQMETLAKAFKTELETATQKALKDMTVVDTGELNPEQQAEKLDKLKDSGNLAGAIGLKLFKR